MSLQMIRCLPQQSLYMVYTLLLIYYNYKANIYNSKMFTYFTFECIMLYSYDINWFSKDVGIWIPSPQMQIDDSNKKPVAFIVLFTLLWTLKVFYRNIPQYASLSESVAESESQLDGRGLGVWGCYELPVVPGRLRLSLSG